MKTNKRTEAWRNAKRINNLPRYDLGTPSVNRGFLLGASRINNVSEYELNPGTGLDNEVEDVKSNMLPNAIANITPQLSMTAPLITGSVAGIGNTAANAGIGATLAVVDNTLGTSSSVARQAIQSIGTTTAKGGTSAASGALSIGTKVLGGIGAAYGLYSMGDYLFGSKRGMTDSQMFGTVSKSREFSHGVGYDTYGNVDTGAVNQLGSAMKTSDTISQGLSGAGTGAAIGSFFTPLGTAIGAGIGALTGLISGIFGGNRKKRRMRREAELTNQAIARYNKQSEADATSEGIKREFYENQPTPAALGIDWSTKVKPGNKHPKYAMVETPEGVLPGPVKSIVGKGEGLINFNNGTASMVETGTAGKDTNYASIDPKDKNLVVLSNSIPVPGTNTTIAQAAEPYIRMLPYAQNIEKMAIMDKLADYTNLLASLKQKGVAKLKNGTSKCVPHYDDGTPWYKNKELWSNVGSYGMMLAPQIFGLLGLNAQNKRIKNARSWVPNAPTLNEGARAAYSIMANRKYRPYAQINALNDATRGILWSTNQAGALSSGQREKIKNSAVLNSAAQAAAIYDKATDVNNKLAGDLANMVYNTGEAEAGRNYDNTWRLFGGIQQQNAAGLKWLVDNESSKYGMWNAGMKDIANMINYKKAFGLEDRRINIYESNAANETAKTNAYINNLNNNYAAPTSFYNSWVNSPEAEELRRAYKLNLGWG